MNNKVIFCKTEEDERNADWDDTALIKAYDDAINSYKQEKLNNGGVPQDSFQKKKTEKKSKKLQINNQEECLWNVGDKCLARYNEDGIVYEAAILSVDPLNQTCQVKYSYYGNEEMQKLDDLKKYDSCNESLIQDVLSNDVSDADDVSIMSERSHKSSSSINRTHQKTSSSYRSHHFPQVPPPPLPDLSSITTESDALQGMLISWYMSGYYTGYYEGLQASKKEKGKKYQD